MDFYKRPPLFNFVGYPQGDYTGPFDLDVRPYSAYPCASPKVAKLWATRLMMANPFFDYVEYKRENGRKVYRLDKER